MNRKDLPSERADIRVAQEKELEAAKLQRETRLRNAMAITFNTPDGLIVLEWLKKECQFGEPILGAMQGAIDEKATLYQAMRLNLYLKVRSFLPFEILKEVEYVSDKK